MCECLGRMVGHFLLHLLRSSVEMGLPIVQAAGGPRFWKA